MVSQQELFEDSESMDFRSGITQTCITCKKIKPIHLFAAQWARVDGTRSYSNKCKTCIKEQREICDALRKEHPYPDKDHRCLVCGDSEEDLKTKNINSHTSQTAVKEKFVLDHNHLTGEFNAYICHTCNSKLAWSMGEDPVKTVKQLQQYVMKHYG